MNDDAPPLRIVPRDERMRDAAHQSTVTLLRDLLADAEAGNITGVLAVVERGDDNTSYVSTGCPDRYARVGRLEALKQNLLRGAE